MKTITSAKILFQTIQNLKRNKKTIGFVPTMGALHAGHVSLIQKARQENDIVVLSIFVNPTQFAPGEDFRRYPREEKSDKKLAKTSGVDIIFYPSSETMYKDSYLTYVHVKDLEDQLCGKMRHNHFQGVCTIVTKLLNIVNPDKLYLGQKDAQQVAILKKMIADLNYSVTIKVCPIIREKDGLALSSRNSYLTSRQRNEAPVLYQSLKHAKALIHKGQKDSAKIKGIIQRMIQETSGDIDCIECVEADTLRSVSRLKGKILIALAVRFGKTRLIDNIIISIS